MNRPKTPSERISLELVAGSELSETDIDILANTIARIIYRNMEKARSSVEEGNRNCEPPKKTQSV